MPAMQEIVEQMNRTTLVEKWQASTEIATSGEIRPTNVVPVIASNRSGRRSVFPMKLDFSGRTILMSVRMETRPMFQAAWA